MSSSPSSSSLWPTVFDGCCCSSSSSSSSATLELIRLLFSNLLLTESESSTFIPSPVALIIVLEVNVLSDAPVLTSIPFDVAFMMVLWYILLLEDSAFK